MVINAQAAQKLIRYVKRVQVGVTAVLVQRANLPMDLRA